MVGQFFFSENSKFLFVQKYFSYPLYIFLVVMNGHPAWKQEFRKYFPKIKIFKKVRPGLVSVEIVEDQKKKLSLETDTYFRQLKSAWTWDLLIEKNILCLFFFTCVLNFHKFFIFFTVFFSPVCILFQNFYFFFFQNVQSFFR